MMFSHPNPYIHGTTSKVLDVIKYTDYSIMSPIDMIETFGLAPLGGELTGGGFNQASCRCYPCFGRIKNEDSNAYDYARVLEYTKSHDNYDALQSLRRQLSICQRCAYSNINVIIILMVRCQQLDIDISDLITKEFIQDIKITGNVFATLLFFGKWLQPIKTSDRDVTDAIYTHLTLANISSKIVNCPDFYEIYLQYKDKVNELPNDIKVILSDLFHLPKKSVIKSGFGCTDKEVNLDITDPFVFSSSSDEIRHSGMDVGYTLFRLTQDCPGYAMNDVLEKYCREEIHHCFFNKFSVRLCEFLSELHNRIHLLTTMRNREVIPKIKHNTQVFPLILICENDSVMKKLSHEYRAIRPLKLGTDITKVATDNDENKQYLVKYFHENNITCNIYMFDEIKSTLN